MIETEASFASALTVFRVLVRVATCFLSALNCFVVGAFAC